MREPTKRIKTTLPNGELFAVLSEFVRDVPGERNSKLYFTIRAF